MFYTHILEENLELYVLGSLSPEQALGIESHLGECQTCKNKLIEVENFARQLSDLGRRQGSEGEMERRREYRIAVDDRAFMRLVGPLSSTRVDVQILDVSRNGLRLCVPEFLQLGTIVQVHLKGSVMLGEVRYCSQVGTEFHEFHVGVRITEVFPNP
ncbi:MAG: PilZ domain-containing protein [Bryobacteraceae bacterium]|jgi:predicted anti-sigma-YlaC factor YlaD